MAHNLQEDLTPELNSGEEAYLEAFGQAASDAIDEAVKEHENFAAWLAQQVRGAIAYFAEDQKIDAVIQIAPVAASVTLLLGLPQIAAAIAVAAGVCAYVQRICKAILEVEKQQEQSTQSETAQDIELAELTSKNLKEANTQQSENSIARDNQLTAEEIAAKNSAAPVTAIEQQTDNIDLDNGKTSATKATASDKTPDKAAINLLVAVLQVVKSEFERKEQNTGLGQADLKPIAGNSKAENALSIIAAATNNPFMQEVVRVIASNITASSSQDQASPKSNDKSTEAKPSRSR